MPNPIKYTTGSETLALKKGNFYIGTGAVGKGPSDTTGYYQGPNVPTNGYVIYMNKVGAPGELSYHSAANDAELISFTNNLAGQSYTTAQQCFNYYYGQTDKVLVNQDYPADFPYIVMDGLVLYLDAGITQSYSGSGTTWSDINGLGPKNNGTLINGPTFNSADGGSIVFDGTNDYVQTNFNVNLDEQNMSICFFFKNLNTVNWTDFLSLITTTNYSLVFERGGVNGSPLTDGYIKVYPITYSSSLSDVFIPGHFVQDSNIHYIALTSSPTQWNLYSETGLYGSGPISGSTNYFNKLSIGTDITRNDNRFSKCNSFTTQIYNRALSESEISQNFNAQKGRFGL